MSQTYNVFVWTMGHSNRSIETFLELLREYSVQVLVDVLVFQPLRSNISNVKRWSVGFPNKE